MRGSAARLHKVLRQVAVDGLGATAIEYALLAAFIAMLIVGALRAIGTELSTTFTNAEAGFSAPE